MRTFVVCAWELPPMLPSATTRTDFPPHHHRSPAHVYPTYWREMAVSMCRLMRFQAKEHLEGMSHLTTALLSNICAMVRNGLVPSVRTCRLACAGLPPPAQGNTEAPPFSHAQMGIIGLGIEGDVPRPFQTMLNKYGKAVIERGRRSGVLAPSEDMLSGSAGAVAASLDKSSKIDYFRTGEAPFVLQKAVRMFLLGKMTGGAQPVEGVRTFSGCMSAHLRHSSSSHPTHACAAGWLVVTLVCV